MLRIGTGELTFDLSRGPAGLLAAPAGMGMIPLRLIEAGVVSLELAARVGREEFGAILDHGGRAGRGIIRWGAAEFIRCAPRGGRRMHDVHRLILDRSDVGRLVIPAGDAQRHAAPVAERGIPSGSRISERVTGARGARRFSGVRGTGSRI